jgi:hypothetical protein
MDIHSVADHLNALRWNMAVDSTGNADPATIALFERLVAEARRLRPDQEMLALASLPHGPVAPATIAMLAQQVLVALRARKPN